MGNKILVAVPKRLGDVLMCTPALQLLAKEMSGSLIDVVTESKLSAETLSGNPLLNEVFVCPSKKTLKKIAQDYTHLINIHHGVCHKSPTLSTLLEANPALNALITHVDCQLDCHQVVYSVNRMATWLECEVPDMTECRYQIFPTSEDVVVAEKLLDYENSQEKLFIGFHLGCHSVAKRARFWKNQSHRKIWDLKYFIELEKKIHVTYPNAQIVITGSDNEKFLANKFCKKCPNAINLTGKTSVKELAAVMDKLDVYVTPDTGTMHLAVATNTPMVILFGPTDPNETGPYPVKPLIHCMLKEDNVDDIKVDSVFENVVKLVELKK